MSRPILMFVVLLSLGKPVISFYCRYGQEWQCPLDPLKLCKHTYSGSNEVCAPPPNNIPRCPNGGDYGEGVCTESFCKALGLYKCPHDPFCVSDAEYSCIGCPNGANNEGECTVHN